MKQESTLKIPLLSVFIIGMSVSVAHASYTSLTLPQLNLDIANWSDGSTYNRIFPSMQTYNGVPFQLAIDSSGNKVFFGGDLDIPVNLFGITRVYTLISSFWGTYGANIGSVTFSGSLGDIFSVDLIEGINVRDHYDGGFNNVINNVDAIPAFNNGSGRARLDQQIYQLPDVFAGQTLLNIHFHSNDFANPKGTPLIVAATVASVPLPSTVWMFGSAFAGVLSLAKRRQR